MASQDLGVQTVFLDAANAYYWLLAAQGELAVAREVERINLESFMAAEAKHAAGIGDLTCRRPRPLSPRRSWPGCGPRARCATPGAGWR